MSAVRKPRDGTTPGASVRDAQHSPPFSPLVALELSGAPASSDQQAAQGERSATSDGARLTWEEDAGCDMFGLALSGGGIRSATFNLGILQGLNAVGLLHALDYVSTVSGGGYIGAFWTAWRARKEAERREDGRQKTGSTADGHELFPTTPGDGRVEPPEIRHLREFSNFLSPRLGVLAYDTGRMAVAAVSATVPALLAALSMIVLVLSVWLSLAQLLLAGPASVVPATLAPDSTQGARLLPGTGQPLWTLGVITLFVLVVTEIAWHRRRERWTWWYIPASIVGMAAVIAAWYFLVRSFSPVVAVYPAASPNVPFIDNEVSITEWRSVFFPTAAWLLGALVIVILRWLFSRPARRTAWRVARGAFDRVTNRLLFTAAAWTVIAVLWMLGTIVWYAVTRDRDVGVGVGLSGIAGTTAALGILFRTVHKLVARTPGPSFGGKLATRLKPKVPQLIAYLTVAGLVATMVAVIVWFEWNSSWAIPLPFTSRSASGLFVVVGLITLMTLVFFDPNEVGLHSFYRARLARAYLGASNPVGRRQTEERGEDDWYLDELPRSRPLHLVCCTANDLSSSDHLANLHRGAVSAVLSPVGFSVGSDWTAWPTGKARKIPIPTLASAITASGAAFNSQMGSKSMAFGPAVTFLMAAFNMRLGLWLPHPTTYARRKSQWFAGLPFYEELLGISRASGWHVHLSDGGHFENMALYELIRRHCRFIIASDCGADPDVGFDDLGNVVRRVREDFGVEIAIDLAPLRPGENRLARQLMVAGDIHYPDGDAGVLLLFKPTLVGDEPADITQYRTRNKAFPHESTGDQFYDEAQWESYRRLGVHAARSAFRGVLMPEAIEAAERDGRRVLVQRWASREFARARKRWLAIPAGLEARIDRIADRAAEVDTLLQKDECGHILREVYKEIDELDRLARLRSGTGGGHAATHNGPNGAPARTPTVVLPRPEDLAPSLHVIRRAILFMEEVYVTEDLERYYHHPLYLGVMNYFARWAYAPLFRMWWPLLKSLYAERFTTFLEQQFKLKGVSSPGSASEGVIARLTKDDDGFAARCWKLQGGEGATHGFDIVSYSLRMTYQGVADPYHIQAAQVRATRAETTAGWDAREFFVPPGLWGIGIGEDFLDRLVRGAGPLFEPGDTTPGVDCLAVRIAGSGRKNAAARKEGADVTQMYRAAGFRELVKLANGESDSCATPLHADDAKRVTGIARRFTDESADDRWLLRCVEGRCRQCDAASTTPARAAIHA